MQRRGSTIRLSSLAVVTAGLTFLAGGWTGIEAAPAGSDRQAQAACLYVLSATDGAFSSAGGEGTVSVTAAGRCSWKAVSHAPAWLVVTSGTNGSGNGTVGYRIAPNKGVSRLGSVTIAGQLFTVHQTAATCCDTSP